MPKHRRELLLDWTGRTIAHIDDALDFLARIRQMFSEGGDRYEKYVELIDGIALILLEARDLTVGLRQNI